MANRKKGEASHEKPIAPEEHTTLQEEKRNIEERIQDTKDATLRLWERTRSLQEKQGILEHRAKLLPWIALAVVVGSVGVSAVITKYQLSQVRQQLAALQTPSPQQAETPQNNGDVERLKQELLESVKQMAPALLAAAVKEGQVSLPSTSTEAAANSTASASPPPAAAAAVKGPGNEALRIVVGQTDPKKTRWAQYSDGVVTVEVDTASAGFSAPPYYFTSLGGHTNNWMAQGVMSIYEPTAKGFRVHVGYRELTAAQAKEWGWYVNWIAIGK